MNHYPRKVLSLPNSALRKRNLAHPFLRVGKTSVVYIRSMKVLAIIHSTLPIIHQSTCFHLPEGPLFSDLGSFIWSGAHLIFLGGHTVSKWLFWKAPHTRRLQAHFDRVDKKKRIAVGNGKIQMLALFFLFYHIHQSLHRSQRQIWPQSSLRKVMIFAMIIAGLIEHYRFSPRAFVLYGSAGLHGTWLDLFIR